MEQKEWNKRAIAFFMVIVLMISGIVSNNIIYLAYAQEQNLGGGAGVATGPAITVELATGPAITVEPTTVPAITVKPATGGAIRIDQEAFDFSESIPKQVAYNTSSIQLSTQGGSGSGQVSYSIMSGQDCIELINDNQLTINKVGTVVVKAIKAEDEEYNQASALITIEIVKAEIEVNVNCERYYGDDNPDFYRVLFDNIVKVLKNGDVLEQSNEDIRITYKNGDTEVLSMPTIECNAGDKATGSLPITFLTNTIDCTNYILNLKGDLTILVDQTKPTISCEPGEALLLDQYNEYLDISINVMDAESSVDSLSITVEKDGKVINIPQTEWKNFTKEKYSWTLTVALEDGSYNNFNVVCKDKAGNESIKGFDKKFLVDTIAPEINVEFQGPSVVNEKYYNSNRKAYITINEKNFDKDEVILKITKNGVTLPITGTNISWTNVESGNMAEILLSQDGSYTMSLNYIDVAGNVAIPYSTGEFVIDKVAPSKLKIQYDSNPLKDFFNLITGGLFFKKSVKVTFYAYDETAGIGEIYYRLVHSEGTSKSESVEIVKGEGQTYSGSFLIEPQFKGQIEGRFKDKAGNETTAMDEEMVADSLAPKISVSYNKTEENGFYKENRIAYILIKEDNFLAEDVVISINKDGINDSSLVPAASSWTAVEGTKDVFKTMVSFQMDGTYTLNVSYTDKSENVGDPYTSEVFVIDNKKPVISVIYSNNNKVENNCYFSQRKATITIVENNFESSDVGIHITAKDIHGKTLITPQISPWVENSQGATANIVYSEDAIYSFDIAYKDKAGNEADNYEDEIFTIDTKAPVIDRKDIIYREKNSGAVAKFINFVSFGYFCNQTVEVSISAMDETSGVKEITYYTKDVDNGKSNEITVASGSQGLSSQKVTFNIEANFKGTVYATAKDYSNNTPTQYSEAVSLITKTDDDSSTSTKTITITPLTEPNKNGFYNTDVEVELSIKEEYAGINTLTYDVGAMEPMTVNMEENEDITYTWNKTIQLVAANNNNNNVLTTVSYKNNTGNNVIMAKKELMIDITKPVITVAYDNNSPINGTYYNKTRTAIISIDELNFKPEDVKIRIFKDEQEISYLSPKESDWITQETLHTTAVIFAEDGDYSMEVSYTDLADNKAEKIKKDEFTIDLIKPVITVIYDNNDVYKDIYYKGNRTATISITEENFNVADILLSLKRKVGIGVIEEVNLSDIVWVKVGNNYTAVISYQEDAKYTFAIAYSDMAGNQALEVLEQTFVIDKVAPSNLRIQYDSSPIKEFFQKITGGLFFKESVKVTVYADDETAGIGELKYNLIDALGAKKSGKVEQVKEDGKTYSGIFWIEPQFKGQVEAIIIDKAGNETIRMDEQIVVDSIAPVISVAYNITNKNVYYNESRIATIQINEANFHPEDVVISVNKDGMSDSSLVPATPSWTVVEGTKDVYKTIVNFQLDGKYTFNVSYSDKSKNVGNTYASEMFVIDKIKPVISVIYDNNDKVENNCYSSKRTATISIIEENFESLDVGIHIIAKDIQKGAIKTPQISQWNKDSKGTIAKIEYSEDAMYSFDITYKDLAGNEADNYVEETFTIDTKTPILNREDIVYREKNGGALAKFINFVSFEYFCTQTIEVSISATDETSGVKEITYYTEDVENGKSKEVTVASDGQGLSSQKTTFYLEPDFKGTVYATAKDYSHNTPTQFSEAVSLITKAESDSITSKNTIAITPLTEPNKNGFYNTDVEVALSIKEEYAGINTLTYDVGAMEPITVNMEDNKDITYTWSETVQLDANHNNNNNVLTAVSYKDNAGNKTIIEKKELMIDITKPILTVSYDNNSPINETYYNKSRTANINIDELNFKSEDVKISIFKNEQEIFNISPKEKDWTTKGTLHTTAVTFAEDGDYTIEVSYTDLADNKAEYVHKDKFTIDITEPTLLVTYDNNASMNGKYYKEQRQAILVIEEHNFKPDEVTVEMTASNNKKSIALPIVSGWRTEGDTQTATILFATDGEYTVSVNYSDMAGNEIAPFEKQEFCIDTTAPKLEITGVEDKHAYKDELVPVITYSDTNFREEQASVSLIGYKRGDVSKNISKVKFENGQKSILDIFDVKKDADDYYTLVVDITDMAGNTAKSEVAFSVNRFGSAYSTDASTKKVMNRYIKKEVDLVLMETNVDLLTEYSISCSKDGVINALKKDQDYVVEQTQEEHGWKQYVYTIYANNFAKEGNYVVRVVSSDSAGNLSDNSIKGEEIKFSVDKTAPKAIVAGVEDKKIYDSESQITHIVVKDNLMLSAVEVKLNGESYSKWNEEEVQKANGDFVIDIPQSNDRQTLKVNFVDAAGNQGNLEVYEFLITQNQWVRYYNNKKAVYASFGGGFFVIALVSITLFRRKKIAKSK